jgi:flagellar hook-basal body complex protein FliE
MIPRIDAAGPELTVRPAESAATAKETRPSLDGAIDGGPDFAAVFEQSVVDASRLQAIATQKTQALARGATDDLHGTMISVKEAEISMKLVGSVRNKLLDAFHELWRINL